MNYEYLKNIRKGKVDGEYHLKTAGPNEIFYKGGDKEFAFGSDELKFISFPKKEGKYTYRDLLKDTEELFGEKGHVYSEEIAVSFYLIFCYLKENALSIERAWGKMQSLFTSCVLNMEYPLKIKLTNDEAILNMHTISIGRFNLNELEELIHNKTTSDYYERFMHDNQLTEEVANQLLSFKRKSEKIILLNISKIFADYFSRQPHQLHVSIFNPYFEAMALYYQEKFWIEFQGQMEKVAAFGGTYYDIKLFRDFNLGDGTMITVFSEIDNHSQNGWVIPYIFRMTSYQTSAVLTPDKTNELLAKYYELVDSKESEFLILVKILINFNAQASKLLFSEGRTNEAFINMWSGLDTIVNNDIENANSNILKNRIAALTRHQFSKRHKEQYFLVSKLYASRSEFVHGGKNVEWHDVISLFEISRAVVWVLLNMHQNMIYGEGFSLEEWYNDLDELVQIGVGNGGDSEELLANVGIVGLD